MTATHYRGNFSPMANRSSTAETEAAAEASIAQSKITSQGQVSIPAEVRRRLGAVPGSVLEWYEEGGQVVVRRIGQFSSQDIHDALFPKGSLKKGPAKAHSLKELDAGAARYVKAKHARR